MPTTKDYIDQLKIDKQNLIDNLREQGVEVSSNATFTDLTPKVLDVGSKPNIFVQTTEPTEKDGIWVETDKTYDKVVIDEDAFAQFEWSDEKKIENIPSDLSAIGYSCFDDTEIFYVCNQKLYKYNYQNKEWSQAMNANLGNQVYSMAMSNKYVVLYDQSTSRRFFIYNRLNDTYNTVYYTSDYSLGSTPGMAIVGEYLYGFGRGTGSSGSNNNFAIKMDLTTGDITTLSIISATSSSRFFHNSKTYYDGNNIIYLFLDDKKVYKYNITDDAYTYVTDLSESVCNNPSCTIGRNGNYLYLPPGNLTVNGTLYSERAIYRYNLLTDEDELIAEVQSNVSGKELNYINYLNYVLFQDAYVIFGGWYFYTDGTNDSNVRTSDTLSLISKTYNQDSLVIVQGSSLTTPYNIELYSNDFEGRFLSPISNVFLYNNNQLYTDLPTYLGNGTTWTKIKG